MSGTLYLNEKYANPHTKQVAAKAIRIWVRVADAFDIDLAARALEGRWLNEAELKALRYLVFRPIEEIELMSHAAVKNIASATKESDKEPKDRKGAVEPNTARKGSVGIANYLTWFHVKVIEPRMPLFSNVSEVLRREVRACSSELKKPMSGTKSMHPHLIRSVPRERYLQIYRTVYLHYADLFRTARGRLARNCIRDRAMTLLGSEGIRPGAIGNIALKDFEWVGKREHGHIQIKDNTSKRSKKLSTSTPVQKGAASSQNYNSEITVKIWPATAEAIQEYIDTERLAVTTRGLRNRSKGFLFLAEHGGPIEDRGTITGVFRRAGKGLAAMGLLYKDAGDPYLQGEAYDFNAYLLRHSAASFFYDEKVMEKPADVVMNLMEQRFGWVKGSAMPSLYGLRAISDAASITVEDYMESLFAEAKVVKSTKGESDEHSQAGGRAGGC
ncbi:hypothetical protein [Paraburkholderia sp. MM5384-R2]|uniref:hypothetical protein n=1 Tax=Paraburkholderia sp. MM5384-R2 TaxID=2723097 RepID=UPI001622E7B7|nr:hypothetical protein [Paraburkholderia sp. MM5384-R2]MBB5503156.1 hypothetical protein [Paraburkholderia sp. MM5384-R2]